MAELILVRHGQANSTAQDAESYDNLSDLGHQQTTWLGHHFHTTNPHFDRVICGTLRRQNQSAAAMGHSTPTIDARLNEFDYFGLSQALQDEHELPMPQDGAGFAAHVPVLLKHWENGDISTAKESFQDFENRVLEALTEAAAPGGRILMVTSGGVISMTLRYLLGLDLAGTAKIMLQTMNSSYHQIEKIHGQLILSKFNATPHLDTPDRAHARTFV
ncbi:MAG: histidine phosphatase family protein [Pseudoruegeria sp.]